MSYIERQLVSGEQVVFTTTRVFKLSTAVFLAVFGFALCFLGAGGAFVGLCVIAGTVLAWYRAKSCEFAVTNKRVVIKMGILSVRTIEMNLDKIESVEVVQPWLRAHASCGNVQLIGSGASRETFVNIMNALEFRRAVQEARDKPRLTA